MKTGKHRKKHKTKQKWYVFSVLVVANNNCVVVDNIIPEWERTEQRPEIHLHLIELLFALLKC